jgi:hypothetical protein
MGERVLRSSIFGVSLVSDRFVFLWKNEEEEMKGEAEG